MWKKAAAFLLQLSYISHHVRALQRDELFPYGTLSGDLTLQEGDDETSKVITLSKPMHFYETSFSKLYVATNGIISPHDLPMEKQYVDDGFPTEFPVIAPFLADIDTSNGKGAIYYRQTEFPSILNRVTGEVQKGFPDTQFTPTHAIVATWENVAAYSEVIRTSESPRKVNTFQVVVAYDEENTYALFLYPEDGLQFFGTRPKEMFNVEIELPARVGFTRGEIPYFIFSRTEGPYFSLTSNEQSVKNLYQKGNSGIPGLWLFHIGSAYSFHNVIPAAVHLPTAVPRKQAAVFQTTPEYPAEEYETDDESFDTEQEYSIDPDFQNPDVTEFPQPIHDASLLGGPNQEADSNLPPLDPYGGDATLSPDPLTDHTAPTNVSPEKIIEPVHPMPGHTLLEAYPARPEGQVVNVDEDVNFDAGVIHYSIDNKETCDQFRHTCSQNAYCADYPSGYCCHCQAGFYGNGRHCLPDGAPQRVNGKVNGMVSVGSTPVGLDSIDFHAYIVVGDGRAYTAISEVPEPLGWALMPVTPIGGLFGWLFALKFPNSHNGFNITGAEFTRHASVTFYPGNQQLMIVQIAKGLDSQNYLNVETRLEGSVPFVPPGASIQMEPFSETYQYYPSLITSNSVREFTIVSAESGAEKFTYQLRQNITYKDCRHTAHAGAETLQLNVERIFAMYVKEERVLRYAITNKIGHVGDYIPDPAQVNPCYVGSHDCDTTAQCVPGEGQHFTCVCATGYTGDGRNCYDVDECAEGLSSCGSQAQCVNLPGSHSCQCQSGFEHGHDSRTCIDVDECQRHPCHPHASCTNTVGSFHCRCQPGFHGDGFQCQRLHTSEERPKTPCEQHRDSAQSAVDGLPLRGAFVPQCDEEGHYRSQQCHGSTGHCWCVDSRGQERAGTRTPPGTSAVNCDAPERPKTQCEQHRDQANDGAVLGAFIPQCDEEGRYMPLQCHGSTGQCWCVDSRGQERAFTRTPPGTPPTNCDTPERPKTQCELHRHSAQGGADGVHVVGAFVPQCDEEGNYRSQQCHGSTGHCWCVDSRGQERAGTRTPPGTPRSNCDAPERPKTQCEQHRDNIQSRPGGLPLVGAFIPQCDEEGRYMPLQCHGSTGHCWCVDSRGQERAGTRTPPGTPRSNCDAPERPKTQCEQHRDNIQSRPGGLPLVGAFIPQCDEEGRYMPLQCHGSTGHCWCVDSRGQERAGTRRPPGTQPANCDAPAHPKTHCEQHRHSAQGGTEGVPVVGAFIPECDEEGNYRPRQCHGSTGHCWCVDSRGQERAGTRTPPGTPPANCDAPERPKSPCEQHRDNVQGRPGVLPLVGGFVPQCDEEGNYRPRQCHGSTGHCWCVDSRGQERAGTRTPPGTQPTNCDAPERPKTQCEQHRHHAQHGADGVPVVGAFIPECDEEGHYKSLQCHGSTGHCWCVDSSGQERVGTRTPPGTTPTTCDAPAHPKTHCEQHRHSAQGGTEGVPVEGAFIPDCDEEGNYRPRQCHGSTGNCWCVDRRGQERAGTRTPPGTPPANCDAPERPKSQCEQHRDNIQSRPGVLPLVGAFIPECDEEGNYRPRQCHGSTGHCWCVDSRGQERAGTRTPPGTPPANCDAPERPKSQCEQHRDNIQGRPGVLPLVGGFIPQCDEEGNYRPRQCHGSTGHCWCVDSRGQERAGTRTPPGTQPTNCDAPAHPKTHCEQHRHSAQGGTDGVPVVGAFIPDCDEEGNYRPRQCHGSTGNCWCVDSRGQERAGTRTPPGTPPANCDAPERPKSQCEQHRDNIQSRPGVLPLVGAFIPECDEEGNYRPRQCHGSTGNCWCVDRRGQERAGTRTPPGTPLANCDAPERPKSQCEQHRDNIQSRPGVLPLIGAFIPQCDEEGNYRPRQCHGSTGHCWCVDSRGQEKAGTRTPPGTQPTNCDAPERPKTQCEQHRHHAQHGTDGVPVVGAFIPECDEEGHYKSLQCHGSTGHCWCVDSSGQERVGTRTPPGTTPTTCDASVHPERPKTQCEQHRDTVQAGVDGLPVVGAFIPQCDEEGRYRSQQCHGSTGHCWCVDSKGQERAGTRTPPGTPPTNCDAPERPKTQCEHHRDSVHGRGDGLPVAGVFIPQCDEEGRYKSLQCHGSTGHCWCVDSRGQERAGTRTPPGTPRANCDAPVHVGRPKTPCEEHRERAQSRTGLVGAFIPQCDEEGQYRSLQCHGSTGHCWCVDSSGQERTGTRTSPGTSPRNCDVEVVVPMQRPETVCERWRASLMEHYGGQPGPEHFLPQCDASGEFTPVQCYGETTYCWCVDKDGREVPGTRSHDRVKPACIPTVPPPTMRPLPRPDVTPPPSGTTLLYAQGQQIGALPLNGTRMDKERSSVLLALHGSIVVGIDYDCRERKVYWTDLAGRTISRAALEPGSEPETLINTGLMSPEGLAVDVARRRMFWVDSTPDKIETAKLDGSDRRVLFNTELVNPRAIIVDSLSGTLYWTDWNREAPKIESSTVEGQNRRVLVRDGIGLPNALTIDPTTRGICWADAGTKRLECIAPDGTGRRVIHSNLNYPFSMVLYANHFYYTDWRRDGVIGLSRDSSHFTDEYLPDQRSHLYGITVASSSCL